MEDGGRGRLDVKEVLRTRARSRAVRRNPQVRGPEGVGPRGPQTGRVTHHNRGIDRLKWTNR